MLIKNTSRDMNQMFENIQFFFFLYKQLMTNQYAGCLISVEELVLKLLKLVYGLV